MRYFVFVSGVAFVLSLAGAEESSAFGRRHRNCSRPCPQYCRDTCSPCRYYTTHCDGSIEGVPCVKDCDDGPCYAYVLNGVCHKGCLWYRPVHVPTKKTDVLTLATKRVPLGYLDEIFGFQKLYGANIPIDRLDEPITLQVRSVTVPDIMSLLDVR